MHLPQPDRPKVSAEDHLQALAEARLPAFETDRPEVSAEDHLPALAVAGPEATHSAHY